MSFFAKAGNFLKGVFGFVQATAPVAEAVGTAIGNPAVVAGAKVAETISAAGATAAQNATATAVPTAKNNA